MCAGAGMQPEALQACAVGHGRTARVHRCTGGAQVLRQKQPAELQLKPVQRPPYPWACPPGLTRDLGRCQMRRWLRPAGAALQPALPDAPPGWRAPAACRGRPCCGLRRSCYRWGAAPPPRPPGTPQARQRRALPQRHPKSARPLQAAPAHTVPAVAHCTDMLGSRHQLLGRCALMCPWWGGQCILAAKHMHTAAA
jgi:hypothetical protein